MPGRRLLRLPLLGAIVAAAAVSGCHKEEAYKSAKVTSVGSEGTFLQVGKLVYQVQISRAMNPSLIQDHDWLQDIPKGTKPPTASEEWFGVWLQVSNETAKPHHRATSLWITDTAGNTYRPIKLGTRNLLAYHAGVSPPHSLYPLHNAIAYRSQTQGVLVLFKLNFGIYQNRPANLHIGRGPGGASVQLDL